MSIIYEIMKKFFEKYIVPVAWDSREDSSCDGHFTTRGVSLSLRVLDKLNDTFFGYFPSVSYTERRYLSAVNEIKHRIFSHLE